MTHPWSYLVAVLVNSLGDLLCLDKCNLDEALRSS